MSVERLLAERAVDRELVGAPISRRSRQTARSLDAYLRAGGRPRWMERLSEIEGRTAMEKRRLERVYHTLEEEYGRGTALFAGRWRAFAEQYRFDAINELIRQHNDWYPIERDLPMDPRTGEYVKILGRSHRRRELDAGWILEAFPPEAAQPT